MGKRRKIEEVLTDHITKLKTGAYAPYKYTEIIDLIIDDLEALEA